MPEVLTDILLLIGGMAALLLGGDTLVRGATRLALRLGVSPLVIGLTVVAFGTSAPELAFNIIAAVKGSSGLSFGNVIGSNIANIGLILGLTALMKPLLVSASVVRREMPLMIVITVLACVLAMLPLPDHPMGSGAGFSRIDGVILLAGFVAFMVMTARSAMRDRRGESAGDVQFVAEVQEMTEGGKQGSVGVAVLLVFLGLVGLVGGGQLAEMGATGLALAAGLSEEFIGLTIVAIATSLPELATSIIAARKGQIDIAVGNVVGSNIFNLALVMGITPLVSPVLLPQYGLESLLVMLILTVLLVPFSRTHGRMLSRYEGGVLLGVYVVAMGLQVWHVVQ